MESELRQPDEGRYLGCFDDNGTLIGSILMMDFTLNVRGVMMPMGAAAYVSTNFLHKKEHIARNLLRVLMGYYCKLGTPVGCLHPFNPAFYRKMGYGHCMEAYFYMPKASAIRSFGKKSDLSYAEAADREEILDYYRAYAARTNGATVHHYMDPHRIFDMPYVVVCRKGGRITGYLTFEFVEVDHYTDMYHDLCVREMIYDDLDTLQQFMSFFASQVDQIDRVRIYSPDPYLHHMFLNPDSGEISEILFESSCRYSSLDRPETAEISESSVLYIFRDLSFPSVSIPDSVVRFPYSSDRDSRFINSFSALKSVMLLVVRSSSRTTFPWAL